MLHGVSCPAYRVTASCHLVLSNVSHFSRETINLDFPEKPLPFKRSETNLKKQVNKTVSVK